MAADISILPRTTTTRRLLILPMAYCTFCANNNILTAIWRVCDKINQQITLFYGHLCGMAGDLINTRRTMAITCRSRAQKANPPQTTDKWNVIQYWMPTWIAFTSIRFCHILPPPNHRDSASLSVCMANCGHKVTQLESTTRIVLLLLPLVLLQQLNKIPN